MLVEVGIDQSLREKCFRYAAEIDKKRITIQKIRQAIAPLLANRKHLNDDQKRNAAEMIQDSQQLEKEIKEMINELRQAVAVSKGEKTPEIEVLTTAFAGVTLRFPRLEAKIIEPLKGPLTQVPQL